ncbi:VPS9 domain-containing protein 1-like [Babylonia areolata]|uniref:VPS9 domain-containing protein 1-like n=1 Tax=Babylonia areolata TaxID=304850 RepID=UPI003FD55169
MDQSLASVMRNINDALRLDDDSHDKEAYQKYLDCVLCITCNLQQYVRTMGGDVVITKQVTKQVKLAQQCVERVAVLVEKIGSTQKPVVLTSPPEEITQAVVRPKPFVVVPPLPAEPTANTFARAKVNSPMEVAYKQNQQLMAAYKARLKRMNKRDPGAFNLSLTIQRKMAENLAIAKRMEMALAKKMQERQERLEEQAAKRFATPIGMSQEEQEQRQIYKKILEYEQDAKWLQAWRGRLASSSREPELICQLIQEILRCRDHPLTVLLRQYQYRIYEKIYPLVVNKRQRLEGITVPLPQSLWPPEMCPAAGKDRSWSGGGSGGEGREEEDEGFQTDQDTVSRSSSTQEEDAARADREDNQEVLAAVQEEVVNQGGVVSGDLDPFPGEKGTGGACVERGDLNCGDSMSDSDKSMVDDGTVADDHSQVFAHTGHQEERNVSEKPAEDVSTDQPVSEVDANNVTGVISDNNSESVKSTADSLDGQNRSPESSDKTSSKTAEETDKENTVAPECAAGSSMSQVIEDTKDKLSSAISKGQHLQTQLMSQQERAAGILRQISQDYEKYNEENMDDLFDEEEEEEEKPVSHPEDQPTIEQPHRPSELHQPSLSFSVSSQSSLGDPDALDSGCGSVSSASDFPSLPPVEEDRSEIQRMSKEAYQRHLKNISADVHQYMEKLLILFTIAYEQLDSPQGRDQCYASLEETFFKPLWKFLIMLFRLANYQEEVLVACKMTQKCGAGPRDMGVTDKLCLVPLDRKDPSPSSPPGEGQVQPYAQAISHLTCIQNHYTMLSKLECVVKVVHLIFDSIKEFYISQGCAPSDVPNVGADDLLPVMSYVVMQSRLPQLVSECQAMAEFIHEGYMMGQEGYCLTTLETAVSFIVTSDLSEPISPT